MGYFQNENYFVQNKAVIKEELSFPQISSKVLVGITEELEEERNSVSIHIRRGDYLELDDLYGGICTLEYYKKAIDYINNHFTEHITLQDIAKKACMTETYFSTIFKKYNGISPWEYITIKRVEKSIFLIKNTDMTKLKIAEKCGFTSSSNFYKAFFKITGKTPSEYINK